jgi:hypothetical protein
MNISTRARAAARFSSAGAAHPGKCGISGCVIGARPSTTAFAMRTYLGAHTFGGRTISAGDVDG